MVSWGREVPAENFPMVDYSGSFMEGEVWRWVAEEVGDVSAGG